MNIGSILLPGQENETETDGVIKEQQLRVKCKWRCYLRKKEERNNSLSLFLSFSLSLFLSFSLPRWLGLACSVDSVSVYFRVRSVWFKIWPDQRFLSVATVPWGNLKLSRARKSAPEYHATINLSRGT